MEHTIAAISTAFGEGGIGIVRISGEHARRILGNVFVPAKSSIVNKRLTYGKIVDSSSGQTLDEVLAVYMKAPYTYTTEDVVEIHCHGSVVALRKVLDLVLRQGAMLAEPGEFTKRAFLNGRLDLTQAEAVIDIIRAKTDKCFDVVMDQLSGAVSSEINDIRSKLKNELVMLAVNIDYPEEDVEEVTYERLIKSLLLIDDRLGKLIVSADTGRFVRDGLGVVIVGKPNVGKSTLLNAFLRESRAIVTEIPGTTRDTIEEGVSIKGIPVRLTDTAGIRRTEDSIEQIGINKSKASFNKADLIILMLDGSEELGEEDREIMSYIGERKAIVLVNKSDLGDCLTEQELKQLLPGSNIQIIHTAMINGDGLTEIEDKIADLVYGGKVKQNESLLITNARHVDLLAKANQALCDAISMAKTQEALDFIELDMFNAYEYLGQIIGESIDDDIINEIFARFCLGK